MFIFTSYVWGCRHAGLKGQRVTNCVSTIHRNIGRFVNCSHSAEMKTACPLSDPKCASSPFNVLNYSDDFAGCEASFESALLSFNSLGSLLSVLGLSESSDKAEPPTQVLTYLGVEFDTLLLEMRVNKSKLVEL